MKYQWKKILFIVGIVGIVGIVCIVGIVVIIVGHSYHSKLNAVAEYFGGQSLYDLMEKEAQISNDVYIQKIRDADVIQSNPWIMIEPVNKNATIHPRGVLDRLTGQQPDVMSWHPRSYYEYSDVLYTGLPL